MRKTQGKIFIIIFFLLLIPNIVSASNFVNVKFNSGYIGYTNNTNPEFSSVGDLEIDLLNFAFEFDTGFGNTRLGIEISPVKFWIRADRDGGFDNRENNRYSILNLGIYWNVFEINITGNSVLSFALFNKINYIHVAEYSDFKWNEFVYSAGVRTVTTLGGFYNAFCLETGYRNTTGRSGFYFSVNIDIGALFFIMLTSKSSKNK